MNEVLTLLTACMQKTSEGRHQVFFKYAPHVQSVEVYALLKDHGNHDLDDGYTLHPEIVYLGDQFYETWPRMVALIEKVKALS